MKNTEKVKKFQILLDEARGGYRESTTKHPKLGALIPFIGKLFLAGIIFRGIIFINPDTYFLQEYLAKTTVEILNSLGGSYQLQNALIIGENNNYLVTRDCLGWKSVSAFIGLLFASTSNLRNHLDSVLLGSTALIGFNIVRVATTVWLSELGVISFDIIHTFFWRWGMTIIVFVLWFIWLKSHSEEQL
jgi:exosortase/archaeosortase family protein